MAPALPSPCLAALSLLAFLPWPCRPRPCSLHAGAFPWPCRPPSSPLHCTRPRRGRPPLALPDSRDITGRGMSTADVARSWRGDLGFRGCRSSAVVRGNPTAGLSMNTHRGRESRVHRRPLLKPHRCTRSSRRPTRHHRCSCARAQPRLIFFLPPFPAELQTRAKQSISWDTNLCQIPTA